MTYTAHPEIDAVRHEAELEAMSERLSEADHQRRIDLHRTFRESLAMGEDSPLPKLIGAEIHTLICEHPELIAPFLVHAARNCRAVEIRPMFTALSNAWVDDVMGAE